MRTIHKYQLGHTQFQKIEIPAGFKPLAVRMQHGAITLWCEVDTEAERRPAWFWVFGTGHDMPRTGVYEYIGTVEDGRFIWHVYKGEHAAG